MFNTKNNKLVKKGPLPLKDKKNLDKLGEKTVFEKYQQLFNYLSFETLLMPVSVENPVEQLMVSISNKGESEQISNKEYLKYHTVIQMMFVNELADNTKKAEEDYHLLQFFSVLPIQFKLEKFWKLNYLLLSLNRVLPIGALGLSNKKEIYYRYTLLTDKKDVHYETVLDIIDMINTFLIKFRRKIVAFVEGRELIDDIIEELEKGLIGDW